MSQVLEVPEQQLGTDELGCQPEAFNPVLKEVDFAAVGLAA